MEYKKNILQYGKWNIENLFCHNLDTYQLCKLFVLDWNT